MKIVDSPNCSYVLNIAIAPRTYSQCLNITTINMPRVSARAQALQDIDHAIECLAYTYALKEPSSD